MKNLRLFIAAVTIGCFSLPALAQTQDSLTLSNFFGTALSQDKAYADLHELCKQAGPRLSGSEGAQKGVEITEKMLKQLGVDSVWLQEVMVPHWVRGEKEQASITSKDLKMNVQVPVCALGNSVGTSKEGIKGQVIEVHGLGKLAKMSAAEIKGKIVFYNEPFDPSFINTFEGYGRAVSQRWGGAMEAVRYGAIGVVVRSINPHVDEWPHTGSMGYNDSFPKLPAVAISTKGAELLSESLKKDKNLTFYFKTSCQMLPEMAKSYNVIGEIKGSEKPKEVIVVGGHLDSWDLAEGAQDDGVGVVQSIEVLRLYKALGIKPKNTIRVVLFMNEENGSKGGMKYAEWAKTSGETNLAAIETDEGGFTPRGFSLDNHGALKAYLVLNFKPLLDKFGVGDFSTGGSGADVGHLGSNCVLLAGLHPDTERYFDFHHNGNDKWENVNDRELEMGAGALASFIYLIDKYGLGE